MFVIELKNDSVTINHDIDQGISYTRLFYYHTITTVDKIRTPKVDDFCILRNWVNQFLKDDMRDIFEEKQMIKKIKITNIKGIGIDTKNGKIEFDLPANKPLLLVAPNGFGKSSFSTAFKSLNPTKIVLEDDHYYQGVDTNRPEKKMIKELS